MNCVQNLHLLSGGCGHCWSQVMADVVWHGWLAEEKTAEHPPVSNCRDGLLPRL